jgi:hypothetical protein
VPTVEDNVSISVVGAGDGDGTVHFVVLGTFECRVTSGVESAGNCRESFYDAGGGGRITFDATAVAGNVFGGWSGDCTGLTATCAAFFNPGPFAEIEVVAAFLLVPSQVQVTVASPDLAPGTETLASATAVAPASRILTDVQYEWSSSNPGVASVSGTGEQATVTAQSAGTSEISASARGVISDPVTVTVGPGSIYERAEFVTVVDGFTLDFDDAGNLFVGNHALSTGASASRVSRVTPAGVVTAFGDAVEDPDVILVDRSGSISTLGAGTVLAAGAYNSQFTNNHITEISADGSVTRPLIESAPPLLSNPSGMAFLANGDLLVGNNGNNTVSRVRRNAGVLELSPFYADNDAPSGTVRPVVHDTLAYVLTGSGKITVLDPNGQVVALDIWPASEASDPVVIVIDGHGSFGGDLIVAASDGRIRRMDRGTSAWTRVVDFMFETPIWGVAISPLDGVLHVIDNNGVIWRVVEN